MDFDLVLEFCKITVEDRCSLTTVLGHFDEMIDSQINLKFLTVLLQHLLDSLAYWVPVFASHRLRDILLVELVIQIVELKFLVVLEILKNDHYYEIGQHVAEVEI